MPREKTIADGPARTRAPSKGAGPGRTLCIAASIDNFAQIESAYGHDIALRVRQGVYERAREFCARESGLVTRSGEYFFFLIDRHDAESAGNTCDDVLEAVMAALGNKPFLSSRGAIFAAISASIPADNDAPFDLEKAGSDETRVGSWKWRTRYAADMQIAHQLLGALDRGELCLRYEKVCSANETTSVRYWHSSLTRVSSPRGGQPQA
ncbi:hypothetical protein [Paraburkholderia aromaticivorans]|uniref:hypothetical protein n=1 Tax=Paraburkholderia aromaticivorans TaxID=2026199 RepID=UPI00145612A8|nr:hypothetical protein [Paraburkholderia aromaticivorans]